MLPAESSKDFSLEPSVASTQEAVDATHQAKLSKLVKEGWHPIPRDLRG